MKLIGDLVAVQCSEENTSTGGIRLPDWKRSLHGKVLAIGPDVHEVKKRDTVCFGATKGMESLFKGFPLRIMREDDIDVVLE